MVRTLVPGQRRQVIPLSCLLLVLVLCGSYLLIRPPNQPETQPPPNQGNTPTASPARPAVMGRDPSVLQHSEQPLLPGAKNWVAWLQSSTAIYELQLGNGQITQTPTATLKQYSSFVAGRHQVIFKTITSPEAGAGTPGTIVRTGHPAAPLPAGLDFPGQLYPGPNGDLWSVPELAVNGPTTATLYTFTGRPVTGQTMTVPTGYLFGDPAGSLLLTNAAGIYQLTTTGPVYLSRGVLLASGARHLLIWDCDQQARCQPYRLNRSTRGRTALPQLRSDILRLNDGSDPTPTTAPGDLSRDGRHAVLPATTTSQTNRLTVLNLNTPTSHTVPGEITDTNPNTLHAWTPDSRWLLTLTNHQLRAFDTTTNRTRTLPIDDEDLLHLTMTGAGGN